MLKDAVIITITLLMIGVLFAAHYNHFLLANVLMFNMTGMIIGRFAMEVFK